MCDKTVRGSYSLSAQILIENILGTFTMPLNFFFVLNDVMNLQTINFLLGFTSILKFH